MEDVMQDEEQERKDKFLHSLKENMGILSKALRESYVSKSQYLQWLDEDEFFAEDIKEIEDYVIDSVEDSLFFKIGEGCPSSIQFFLKTRGAKRGYMNKG